MALPLSRKTSRMLTINLAALRRAVWRPPGNWLRPVHSWRHEPAVQGREPNLARSLTGNEETKVEWVSFAGRTVARCGLEEGDSLLEVARAKGVELEGACDGNLACSTCHVVLEERVFGLLDRPSDEEEDLLGLAHGLERCSRLGCQVKLSQLRDVTTKVTVKLPSAFATLAASDSHAAAGGDGAGS